MTEDDFQQTDFGHVVLLDEDVPSIDGWRVWCVPHGPLGAYQDRTRAFLAGLEHDADYGGGSCR